MIQSLVHDFVNYFSKHVRQSHLWASFPRDYALRVFVTNVLGKIIRYQ